MQNQNTKKEFEGYRILIAEDGEIDREIVANIVEDLGAECLLVGDGEELLEVLNGSEGEKIDLVLTDIYMPRKTGIEACSEFRASSHPKAWSLPIIGISADTNSALFDKAISAGMNSMTLKPLTRETLRAHFHITLKDNMANMVFNDRIRQALSKNLFFSTISHDLRTPLNAIIGFSELLKCGFDSPAEREVAIDSILMSSKVLLHLINDILDLSKLDSGRMEIEPEPTDIANLLREIAAAFGITHRDANFEILCRVKGVPNLLLDPHRIRQIVFNLVGNAVKFTKKGFVEIRASFEPDETLKKGLFKLEVQDTGCGIGLADQKKLATPFVQLGAGAARAGGSGLGLYICRMLAAAMGGKMQIKSVLGEGSTFSIVIPNVCIAPDLETLPSPENVPSHARKCRVLVADDTKLNQIVLKTMFSKLGVTDVVLVSDGKEALEKLTSQNEGPFDFVLTDMWMPNLDGLELVKIIRANEKLAKLPVYLFTAEVEMKTAYAQKGFDGILLKPATLEDLQKLIPS